MTTVAEPAWHPSDAQIELLARHGYEVWYAHALARPGVDGWSNHSDYVRASWCDEIRTWLVGHDSVLRPARVAVLALAEQMREADALRAQIAAMERNT